MKENLRAGMVIAVRELGKCGNGAALLPAATAKHLELIKGQDKYNSYRPDKNLDGPMLMAYTNNTHT